MDTASLFLRTRAQSSALDAARNALEYAARCAVFAFLVAVPATGVWVPAGGHDYARVMEIGLCLVCAVGTACRRSAGRAGKFEVVVAFLLLALALVSTLQAPELQMAARELALLIGLSCVFATVARWVERGGFTVLLGTVALAGALYASLALLGLAANLATAATLRPFDLLIGYDNGRFFNHVQTSMLPLLALATLHSFANRAPRRLAAFGLAVGIALLVLSEGRATGSALLAAGATGTVLFQRPMRPILRSAAIASGFAAVIYLVAFAALPKLFGAPVEVLHADGIADTGSAHARFVLWRIALAGIERSPWLGIGPMHFSHTWNSDAAHPHNIYLQVAEEWGVPMLLLLLGIAFIGLRALYRAVRDHRGDDADRRTGLVLFVTVIAIGIDGMLSGNFVMPVSQVWIAVVFGAAVGWVRRNAPQSPGNDPSLVRTGLHRGLQLVPLVAMLWLAASVSPELGTHLLDRRPFSGTATDAGAPRFWSNGWF